MRSMNETRESGQPKADIINFSEARLEILDKKMKEGEIKRPEPAGRPEITGKPEAKQRGDGSPAEVINLHDVRVERQYVAARAEFKRRFGEGRLLPPTEKGIETTKKFHDPVKRGRARSNEGDFEEAQEASDIGLQQVRKALAAEMHGALEDGATASPDLEENGQQQIVGTQTRGAGNGEKQGLSKGRVQRQQFNFLAGLHAEPKAARQGFLPRIRDAIKKI
jgi:hypothetical protein